MQKTDKKILIQILKYFPAHLSLLTRYKIRPTREAIINAIQEKKIDPRSR